MSTLYEPQAVVEATGRWLESAVIGLNLCPFAGLPWRQGQVRMRVSDAASPAQLAEHLAEEVLALQLAEPVERETTLLIHPHVLTDFLEYNDFLDLADGVMDALGLDGIIQVASFHPEYRFADCPADDPAHCTNRSPYPMLHLLREASIEAATARLAEPEAIYERNIQTLRELGFSGWHQLMNSKGVSPVRS